MKAQVVLTGSYEIRDERLMEFYGTDDGRVGGASRVSQWSHDNPEKVGTEDDPWMIHDSYRKAVRMGDWPRGMPSYAELERNSQARCRDCQTVQAEGPECIECGGELGENDY